MAVSEAVHPPKARAKTQTKIRSGLEEAEPYTTAEFAAVAAAHPDLRLELTREGELIIMPPVFPETGSKNADITADVVVWNRLQKTGKVFDSSSGFTLPNGAKRSPDTAWIELGRWGMLTEEERKGFSRICPDFVVELRSKTDRLSAVQKKMREYRDNGARLGWLIDPKSQRVEIYRPGQEAEIVNASASLSGEDVLPEFVLDLTGIMA